MRNYVKVHHDYTDMELRSAPEISDIIYTDTMGVLTKHLIERGYLSRDDWSEERPKYLIEVKTTTMSCETPLYMSKAQHKRVSFKIYSLHYGLLAYTRNR
jgi:hypothetical protein